MAISILRCQLIPMKLNQRNGNQISKMKEVLFVLNLMAQAARLTWLHIVIIYKRLVISSVAFSDTDNHLLFHVNDSK